MRRARKSGLAGVAALALAACQGCGGEEASPAPREISGPAKRAAATVERLERALSARDFATVCARLLTPAARERSGGEDCAAELRTGAGGVRRPRLRVLSVALDGPRAAVRVRTTARGQAPVDETLRLRRSDVGYRIAELAP